MDTSNFRHFPCPIPTFNLAHDFYYHVGEEGLRITSPAIERKPRAPGTSRQWYGRIANGLWSANQSSPAEKRSQERSFGLFLRPVCNCFRPVLFLSCYHPTGPFQTAVSSARPSCRPGFMEIFSHIHSKSGFLGVAAASAYSSHLISTELTGDQKDGTASGHDVVAQANICKCRHGVPPSIAEQENES